VVDKNASFPPLFSLDKRVERTGFRGFAFSDFPGFFALFSVFSVRSFPAKKLILESGSERRHCQRRFSMTWQQARV
jgi:hypothetical protein